MPPFKVSSERRAPLHLPTDSLSPISTSPSSRERFESTRLSEPDFCKCTPGGNHSCWDVDFEVYGVSHSDDIGCTTCNNFVSHIHHSRRQRVRGIAEAYTKMHERHDIMWRRGLEEGERRNPSNITTPQGRSRLVQQLNLAQVNQAVVEEELRYLTQLYLGQISLDEFLSMFTSPTFATREEFRQLARPGPGSNQSLWNDDLSIDEENSKLARESYLSQVASEFDPVPKSLSSGVPSGPTSAGASPIREAHTSFQVYVDNDVNNLSATPLPSSEHPSTRSRPGEDIPGYYNDNRLASETKTTLRSLFEAAHAGDADALVKCKALCREAHLLNAQARTFGMRFVLIHWKKPSANINSSRGEQSCHRNRRQSNVPVATVSSGTSDAIVALTNPKMTDPPEMWYEYLKTHSRSWPNGVRRQDNGNPWMPDLRASRIFAQLRPTLDNSQHQVRNQFTIAVLSLFTDRGRYKTLVRQLGLQVSSFANYVPFTFNGSSTCSEEDVARHYASCGVTVKEVENEIEGWAVQHELERKRRGYGGTET
ncbi:hypothetical protein F5050DRAFT_1144494 [Lentinula boryana]|uniref:Uncharacterized protein n=1 Tax=Lentinula boryana TaxID=40481 RepID=A0ABQ8QU56_9AGAR|nr:hypothetical protein F5050DRAFT_1144494 [Lentinula boryana]